MFKQLFLVTLATLCIFGLSESRHLNHREKISNSVKITRNDEIQRSLGQIKILTKQRAQMPAIPGLPSLSGLIPGMASAATTQAPFPFNLLQLPTTKPPLPFPMNLFFPTTTPPSFFANLLPPNIGR